MIPLPDPHQTIATGVLRPLRSIFALMLREMATSHGRSAGGYLWTVAEPVLGIALLAAAFSLAFHAPPLGNSFPLFYATGLLPYLTYMGMGRRVGTAITFSRPFLAYPAVALVDAILARALLTLLTQVAIFCLLIIGIEAVSDTHSQHDYPRMVGSLAMAGALGVGVGTLNCFLWTLFPDWERIWGVLNKPLFLLSAILFTVEDLPATWQGWIWFNPLVHVTAEMRRAFYPSYDGAFVSYSYVLGLAMAAMVAGLLLLVAHRGRLNL
ncbi:MAG: ABC transporter permease [Paracoccaceae bacterium]